MFFDGRRICIGAIEGCPHHHDRPGLGNGSLLSATLSCLSSRAYPDFLLHRSHRRPLMWFSLKRTTAVDRSRNSQQEIQGNRGICSSADVSWKWFYGITVRRLDRKASHPIFAVNTQESGPTAKALAHSASQLRLQEFNTELVY